MNILFQRLRLGPSLQRAVSTSPPFVPPASLQNLELEPRREKHGVKTNPESPTFYTGRATYYDQVIHLETAVQHSRSALTNLQLLPLPAFARAKLPAFHPIWKPKENMSGLFSSKLTTSRYRRVTALLNQLSEFQLIASTAGCYDLGEGIAEILELFQRESVETTLARKRRMPVQFDEYGRTYTVGKRKTSAARVWIIPVQQQDGTSSQASIAGALLGLEPSMKPENLPTTQSDNQVKVCTTAVLVNNIPLAEYFLIPADRERVIRPLKLTGVLGAYNVFALVRGGGTTGQSGAIAHGVAKGLSAHEPMVEAILRRAKLLRRDPRMVERKKTGLAKARKRYTWVKR